MTAPPASSAHALRWRVAGRVAALVCVARLAAFVATLRVRGAIARVAAAAMVRIMRRRRGSAGQTERREWLLDPSLAARPPSHSSRGEERRAGRQAGDDEGEDDDGGRPLSAHSSPWEGSSATSPRRARARERGHDTRDTGSEGTRNERTQTTHSDERSTGRAADRDRSFLRNGMIRM